MHFIVIFLFVNFFFQIWWLWIWLSGYLEALHKYIYCQYNHVLACCAECLLRLKYQDIPRNVLAASIKKPAQFSYCKSLYSQNKISMFTYAWSRKKMVTTKKIKTKNKKSHTRNLFRLPLALIAAHIRLNYPESNLLGTPFSSS